MQIIIPYLVPLENVSDILDLLGNSKKFKERMTILNDAQTDINAKLKTVEDINKLGELHSQAASLLASAREVKTHADTYAEKAKSDANKEAEGILATAKNTMAELAARESAVANREGQAAIRGTAQDAREKELEGREAKVDTELERAAQLARQAQTLQDKLTAKLGQIQAAAAE